MRHGPARRRPCSTRPSPPAPPPTPRPRLQEWLPGAGRLLASGALKARDVPTGNPPLLPLLVHVCGRGWTRNKGGVQPRRQHALRPTAAGPRVPLLGRRLAASLHTRTLLPHCATLYPSLPPILSPPTVDEPPHVALPHRHTRLAGRRLAQLLNKPAEAKLWGRKNWLEALRRVGWPQARWLQL